MPPKRDRPRVKGSWRDKGKGECFTRTNKNGGKYVVCNDPPRGSKGQAEVYERRGNKSSREAQAKTRGATKIQAIQRGRKVREKAKKEKEKKEKEKKKKEKKKKSSKK
tara:strand:- start:135 stop:458 length:324 start_codon:yes stop_codon:yes gene_type:complete